MQSAWGIPPYKDISKRLHMSGGSFIKGGEGWGDPNDDYPPHKRTPNEGHL